MASALLWALASQGQILNVTSIQPLNIPAHGDAVMQAVAISPQGDYMLLSTDTKRGLVKWDLTTSTATTLTDAEGCGSDVRISDDGRQVVYDEASFKNKRRHHSVKAIDMTTGKKKTLVKSTRNLQGFDIQGNNVMTSTDGTMRRHSLVKNAALPQRATLTHHHLKLYVTRNGVTSLLAPNGVNERYIWSSLSPDGEHVLYYVGGHGAFVCDLDGSHLISLGDITYPKWWDDNTVIGTIEEDNEYSIIASSVVACTLDGHMQTLTGPDVIATSPLPCAQSEKIAFSTPDGQIYLMLVE